VQIPTLTMALNLELAKGGPARETFELLLTRGHTRQSAFELMFHAKCLCIAHTEYGLTDRWPEIIMSLREGRTIKELFPDALYTKPAGPAN
jgi:hypothetical protein